MKEFSILFLGSLVLLATIVFIWSRTETVLIFSIEPRGRYVLEPETTIAQRIRILPESNAVRIFLPLDSTAEEVVVSLLADTDGTPDTKLQDTVLPVRVGEKMAWAQLSLGTLDGWYWISVTAPDDQPITILREQDSSKYPGGSILVNGTEPKAGVLGFGLYSQQAFSLRMREVIFLFGTLILALMGIYLHQQRLKS